MGVKSGNNVFCPLLGRKIGKSVCGDVCFVIGGLPPAGELPLDMTLDAEGAARCLRCKHHLPDEEIKIPCPCCGKTRVDEFDICDECFWENDPVQFDDPDFAGGANEMSLNEARKAYREGREVR